MADGENESDAVATVLPGAHRVIRMLDAKEGPFSGALVTSGDTVCVRVDAAALDGWAGWSFSGMEHIAAPIDVCRRRGGHGVLLPWCTDRVLGYLVRRTAGEEALSAGECSTLVISLLRGLDELGEGAEGVRTGEWWLTDDGRPILVLGAGGDARVGAIEILERLQEESSDKVVRRALGTIAAGLERTIAQPRLPTRLLETWETELLHVAAPQPLKRGGHAPARARDVARTIAPSARSVAASSQRLRADRARGNRRSPSVGRDALSAAARAVVARVHAVRDRVAPGLVRARSPEDSGSRTRRRRGSLIAATGAAVVVLVVGLLWPSGDVSGSESDSSVSAAPAEKASAAPEKRAPLTTPASAEDRPPERDSVRGEGADDPVLAAPSLVIAIAACLARDDASCPEAVAPGSGGVVDALAGAGDERTPSAELVDEYGDVAVVRLAIGGAVADGEDGTDAEPVPLIVVLIRVDDKWLVRDVYDVADQPG